MLSALGSWQLSGSHVPFISNTAVCLLIYSTHLNGSLHPSVALQESSLSQPSASADKSEFWGLRS